MVQVGRYFVCVFFFNFSGVVVILVNFFLWVFIEVEFELLWVMEDGWQFVVGGIDDCFHSSCST